MKKLAVLCLFTVFISVLCGCTKGDDLSEHSVSEKPEDIPETPILSEEVLPINISPVATEKLLEPLDEFSWEREYPPEYIMLHFTSAVVGSPEDPYNIDKVRGIFIDGGVSIHYIIDRDGTVFCYIPEDRAAWHAGKGSFADDARLSDSMNKYSIGIEMLAIGSMKDMSQYLTPSEYKELDDSLIGFTDAQYESLGVLVSDICARNGIPFDREHIIGHDMYNPKKSDPGELFDYDRLFG